MQQEPVIVQPYAGQNQQQRIVQPRSIQFQSWDGEEGCWLMPPYAQLYPPPTQSAGEAWVPPPVSQTDIFMAQQTWPL